jgi:hypothetical protein
LVSVVQTSLRQKLRGIFIDFEELSRSVIIETAYRFAYVPSTVDVGLVLTLPRFYIDNRNASVECSEILLRGKRES